MAAALKDLRRVENMPLKFLPQTQSSIPRKKGTVSRHEIEQGIKAKVVRESSNPGGSGDGREQNLEITIEVSLER